MEYAAFCSTTLSGQITFDYASHIIIDKIMSIMLLGERERERVSGRWQCVVAFDFCRVSTWGKWSCMAYTPLAFGHHHFGDSFPPPAAALPLPGLHLHALNPRGQSRKYTEKKTFHYNNRKKRRAERARQVQALRCVQLLDLSMYVRASATLHLKILPFLFTQNMGILVLH